MPWTYQLLPEKLCEQLRASGLCRREGMLPCGTTRTAIADQGQPGQNSVAKLTLLHFYLQQNTLNPALPHPHQLWWCPRVQVSINFPLQPSKW